MIGALKLNSSEGASPSDLHVEQSFVPRLDDHSRAYAEAERSSTVAGGVELGAVLTKPVQPT